MANLVIKNTVSGNSGAPTLYDQQANQTVQVWFEHGGVEAFTADPGTPVAGEYAPGVWSEIYGPDGPLVTLVGGDGTIASPKEFTPTMPGRWLVRLVAEKYVLDSDMNVVLSGEPETFTALYEIQDPNIIGHRNAKPYGNGSVTRGTSTIAPTESTEFDSDEGWSRGVERYLATVSREQGFRSTVVVYNDSGVQLDSGKVITVADSDALQVWKNADSSLEDFQNTILRVVLASSGMANLGGLPLFLAVEDILDGDRGVAIVEGVVPFDTTLLADGDALFVSALGEPTGTVPSSLVPTDVDVRIGITAKGGVADDATNPGFLYFHGHAHMLPGLVQGPLSSTDNAIATWDGVGGNKLQNTGVRLMDMTSIPVPYWEVSSFGDSGLHIRTFPGGDNELWLITGDTNDVPSGDVKLNSGVSNLSNTGDVAISTGTASGGTAGTLWLYAGTSDLSCAPVKIHGGRSYSGQGGHVEITGGRADTAGLTPGGVIIQGGENTADSTRGNIAIEQAELVTVDAVYSAITTAPIVDYNGELTRWYSKDPAGVGANELRAQLSHDYGVNTKFSMLDTAGFGGLELNSDSHSFFLNKLSIGTTVAPAGVDQLHVEGSATFTDLTVTNKLNVGGLIDPIGLILSNTSEVNIPVLAGEGALFVSDGTDGLTAGDIYYKDSTGGTTSLTAAAGAGVLTGPMAPNSTENNQVATWANSNGDDLKGSGLTISHLAEISSLKNAAHEAYDISIKPGLSTTGADNPGANVTIEGGEAEHDGPGGSLVLNGAGSVGDAPGDVTIQGGSTSHNASDGGSINLKAGDGNLTVAGATDGGGIMLKGGKGANHGGPVTILGGDAEDAGGLAGYDNGGSVTLQGGSGGREGDKAGPVDILGGTGGSGKPAVYRGGAGGEVSVFGGSAGPLSGHNGGKVSIRGGTADSLDPAIGLGNLVGQSGNVEITGGEGPPVSGGFVHTQGGGILELRGGDSNPVANGDGGDVVVEPGKAGTAPGKHGLLLLCNEDDGAGFQKSFVSIGSELVSGLPGPIGWCGPKPAHTIHGDLKVTGVIDPVAFFMEPQTSNPVEAQFIAAQAAGQVDENGDPIDVNDPAVQLKIKNSLWVDENNDYRMMVGSEPVGTEGTIKYDSDNVVYDAGLAIHPDAGGILVGDLSPEVHYFNVPEVTGILLVDSTLGDIAIMLPDATLYPKRSIFVKDKKGKSNVPGFGQILIVPPSGQKLDHYCYPAEGGSGPYPVQPWASIQCYSDGTDWFII